MITAKPWRRLLLLLLCFCCLLSACQTNDPPPELYALEKEEDSTLLQDPIAEHLYVILPADADEALSQSATLLAEELFQQTAIPTELYYDDQSFVPYENAAYVLLGPTCYIPSERALAPLKRDDYLCRWEAESRTLLLGGKSHAATVAAVTQFRETLLSHVSPAALLQPNDEFLILADYEVDTLLVNGHSFGDYAIVYTGDEHGRAHTVALALRRAIADRCGFYPPVVKEGDCQQTERLLVIRETEAERGILSDGSAVRLCAPTLYELCNAAEALTATLLPPDAPNALDVTLPEYTAVSAKIEELCLSPLPFGPTDDVQADTLSDIQRALAHARQTDALLCPIDRVNDRLRDALTLAFSEYASEQRFYYRSDGIVCQSDSTQAAALQALHPALSKLTLLSLYDEEIASLESLLSAQDGTPTLLLWWHGLSDEIPSVEQTPDDVYTLTLGERQLSIAFFDSDGTEAIPVQGDTPYLVLRPMHPFLSANATP